jgi:carboxyl-terminal processing protease
MVLSLLYAGGSQGVEATDENSLLDEIWRFAGENFYPPSLRVRFDRDSRAAVADDVAEGQTLNRALNSFLTSLDVSHTRFYDRGDQGFYLLRSLFTSRNPDEPSLDVLGLQLTSDGLVQAVFEGFPAGQAGVRIGERIVAVNGRAFESVLDWQGHGRVTLTLESGKRIREIALSPVRMGYHRALIKATENSYRAIDCDDQQVGYLHLWSGTHDAFLAALRDSVAESIVHSHSGFILDLRDGYGGAWWDYLDPFFPDRQEYFEATLLDGGSTERMVAEPAQNPDYFAGSLVVLINAGTRSGKESLAFQFAKTRRARLIGTTTAGAFTAGMGVFSDRPQADYLLYLSVAELRLDDKVIEGVGVTPDLQVETYPDKDAPLEAALGYLGCESGSQ